MLRTRCRTLHPDAIAWAKAAITQGGAFTSRTLRAVSTFAENIERAGLRDRFLRLNLVCGTNLAAARTPLYRGASLTGTQYGNAIDTNLGPFVSGDYSEATGLQGNGTSKALDTGLTIASLVAFGCEWNSVHISVYRRDTANGPDWGGATYLGGYFGACMLDTTTAWYGNNGYFHTGSGNQGEGKEILGDSVAAGFTLAQAGPEVWLLNDVDNAYSVASSMVAFDASDTMPLYAGGVYNVDDNATEISSYSSGLMAAYSVGLPFATSGQRTAYYNAMQAFQAALGRAV